MRDHVMLSMLMNHPGDFLLEVAQGIDRAKGHSLASNKTDMWWEYVTVLERKLRALALEMSEERVRIESDPLRKG